MKVTFKNSKKTRVITNVALILTIFVLCFQLFQIKTQYNDLVKQFIELRESLSQEESVSYDELSLIVDSVYGIQAIEKHLENNESFAFVLGTETCQYCQIYKEETLNHYDAKKTGITLLEVDTDHAFLFEEDLEAFTTQLGLDYVGTPTTVFIKEGEVVEEYAGVLTLDELTEKLEALK